MMSQDASGSSETNLVRYPYRRGAKLVGADGQMVGTLEQLVVDRDSGVLRSLIVRSADGAREAARPRHGQPCDRLRLGRLLPSGRHPLDKIGLGPPTRCLCRRCLACRQ